MSRPVGIKYVNKVIRIIGQPKVGDQVRLVGGHFTPSQRKTLWIVDEVNIFQAWISRIEDRDSRIYVNHDNIKEATVLDLLGDI